MSACARKRLPNRRNQEVIEFGHSGFTYIGAIGRFDDGRLAEFFLTAAKTGTAVQAAARDAAIVASLALQRGVRAEVLRHALTHNSDGSPSSALGKLLDILAADGGADGVD